MTPPNTTLPHGKVKPTDKFNSGCPLWKFVFDLVSKPIKPSSQVIALLCKYKSPKKSECFSPGQRFGSQFLSAGLVVMSAELPPPLFSIFHLAFGLHSCVFLVSRCCEELEIYVSTFLSQHSLPWYLPASTQTPNPSMFQSLLKPGTR